MLWLRPGSSGIQTMRRFLSLVADRYYQVMRDTIRKHDPNALFLGDRFQSFYYPEVPVASRPYVDVVSTNLNASWNDGHFIRSYLDTLHALTDKPVIVSEFYAAAAENSSGNKNEVGGFPEVATQKDRGEVLSNTLRGLIRLPYVVGADWFQYYDEPPHGRKLDGADYNFGLVDIHDEPYHEVVEAFSALDLTDLKSAGKAARGSAADGVPRAPADPAADFQFMGALKNWDRERGHVPATTANPTGDLYVCWSPEALYLGTFVIDIVEPDYYRDREIPDIDRVEWKVRVNGGREVTARVGAAFEPQVDVPGVEATAISGTYHDVRCINVLKLPAALFGKKRLQAGDRIALDSSFTTHGRAHRIGWEGEYVLGD